MKKTPIIVADDHTLFRSGLVNILDSFDMFESIHEAGDGTEVLELMKRINPKPELVLLDVKMPQLNGFDTMKQLKELYPGIKVVMLTMVDQEQFISHMLKEDVNAYLLKNVTETELKNTLVSVLEEGYYLDQRLIRIMHKSHTSQKTEESFIPFIRISEREQDVLEMLCEEYSATEIAENLHISRRTVEVHKQNMMEKTNTKNTVGLVLFAIRNGIVKVS